VDLETAYVASGKPEAGMIGDRYHHCSGDAFDAIESRRSNQMSSSAPIETDMHLVEGLDHSDEERNGLTRPSLAR
jgi:hypothetical protein